MAFNLQDYETVEERIRKFYATNDDGRIITEWVDFAQEDGKAWRWVVKTSIYLNADDQEKQLPKATGFAMEYEAGKQAEWAIELAETSSIGRALANMNLSGNKRASREEMAKVARAEQVKRDWLGEADKLALSYDVDGLRLLYTEAVAAKASADALAAIKAHGSAAKP
jgi:hypothetical protein